MKYKQNKLKQEKQVHKELIIQLPPNLFVSKLNVGNRDKDPYTALLVEQAVSPIIELLGK